MFKGTSCTVDNPLLRALHAAFMESGLNTYELEERSGVARNTLYYWFNNEKNWPNLRHLYWVAEALGCELVLQKKPSDDARRCVSNRVEQDGSCLVCGADQGEACRGEKR